MTQDELSNILKNHKHWITKDCDGWDNMRANLCGADLSGLNLCGAYLSGANLRYANLCNTNLCGACLSGADLRDADLCCANLCGACLSGVNLFHTNLNYANLRCADLRDADLCYANLSYADLRDAYFDNVKLRGADLYGSNLSCADLHSADLCDTNLYGSNLCDANLNDAEGALIEYRKGKILTEQINGYKKCKNEIIVTLLIPRGAIVFSINGNKCRTNRAKVINIDGADRAYSSHNNNMSYYVGDEFNIYDFNCEYNVECGKGIHFFMTREEAENY